MNRLMGLTNENDECDKQALNRKAHLDIPERSLKMVLVGLPESPPGKIEKEGDVNNELTMLLQKTFQPISPLGICWGMVGHGICSLSCYPN